MLFVIERGARQARSSKNKLQFDEEETPATTKGKRDIHGIKAVNLRKNQKADAKKASKNKRREEIVEEDMEMEEEGPVQVQSKTKKTKAGGAYDFAKDFEY